MRSSAIIAGALLVAGSTAAPNAVEMRATAKQPTSKPDMNYGNNTSKNWAGSVVNFKSVNSGSTVIKVPKVSIPPGGSKKKTYGGRAWVGLDGEGKCKNFANAGIQWTVKDNVTSYAGFYQVSPGPSYFFDMEVTEGDYYAFSSYVSGGVNAQFSITNVATSGSESKSLHASKKLCNSYVNWIVEDYAIAGSLVPMAQFDNVQFIEAYAGSPKTSGVIGTYSGSDVALVQNGETLVSCFSTSGEYMGYSTGVYECDYHAQA